jgi:hypothetical protein
VLEPETLEDVEAIITKAGSEQKLVVIDFSATWYVVPILAVVLKLLFHAKRHRLTSIASRKRMSSLDASVGSFQK